MKDTQQMLQTEREKLNHDTDISLVKNTREDWIILEKKQVLFYIWTLELDFYIEIYK